MTNVRRDMERYRLWVQEDELHLKDLEVEEWLAFDLEEMNEILPIYMIQEGLNEKYYELLENGSFTDLAFFSIDLIKIYIDKNICELRELKEIKENAFNTDLSTHDLIRLLDLSDSRTKLFKR